MITPPSTASAATTASSALARAEEAMASARDASELGGHIAHTASTFLGQGELLEALRSLPLSCAVFSPAGALLWFSAAASLELKLRGLDTRFTELVEQNAALARWRAAAQEACTGEATSVRIGQLTVQRLPTPSGPLLLVLGEHSGHDGAHSSTRLRESWQLTARESEVLVELAAGRSNKDIAVRLDCSARTVDVHVSSLLRKAQCTSRAELIARLLSTR